MLVRLKEKVDGVDDSLRGTAPSCPTCHRKMENRGRAEGRTTQSLLGKLRLKACEQQTETQVQAALDASPGNPDPAPDVTLIGRGGCTLGMQVRQGRRRGKSPDEKLPDLPAAPDGGFREVKAGAVFLPAERVPPSPVCWPLKFNN